MSKSGGLEYTKVAEIRALLVVDEVIPEFEICGRWFLNVIGFKSRPGIHLMRHNNVMF